jgi:hypothetical protein
MGPNTRGGTGAQGSGRQPSGGRRGGTVGGWTVWKDTYARYPYPESGALPLGHTPVDEPDSCSGPARAGSSHVRCSGESGAHPGRESGAHAKNRKNQVPPRGRLRTEIVSGMDHAGQQAPAGVSDRGSGCRQTIRTRPYGVPDERRQWHRTSQEPATHSTPGSRGAAWMHPQSGCLAGARSGP